MKLRSATMLLCLIALAGCGTINAKRTQIANSHVPPIFDGQFACPAPANTELPSDTQLRSWDAERTFRWGEANWRWGNGCAELMDYNRHYYQCRQGDRAECTYVNQQRPAMIEKFGTEAAKAAQ